MSVCIVTKGKDPAIGNPTITKWNEKGKLRKGRDLGRQKCLIMEHKKE